MDDWNTSFLLGWPIFRCYVSFRDQVFGEFWKTRVPTLCLMSSFIPPTVDGRRLASDGRNFLVVFPNDHNSHGQLKVWTDIFLHFLQMRALACIHVGCVFVYMYIYIYVYIFIIVYMCKYTYFRYIHYIFKLYTRIYRYVLFGFRLMN